MAITKLFELALQITSKGVAEAKAALASVDATGKKTAQSAGALTDKIKQQDLALRKLAEAGLRSSDVGRRMDEQLIKQNGGMQRFIQIQKQLADEARQADAVIAKLNTTTGTTVTTTNAAGGSVLRFRSGLTSLATQAIGTSSAVGQLASSAAVLALGAGAGVAIIAGIAAIAVAYDKLTEGAQRAKKASDDLQESLSKQRKAERAATLAGKIELLELAKARETEAKEAVRRLNETGPATERLHKLIEGRLAEATANRIQQEKNVADARREALDEISNAWDTWRGKLDSQIEKNKAAQKKANDEFEKQQKEHLDRLVRQAEAAGRAISQMGYGGFTFGGGISPPETPPAQDTTTPQESDALKETFRKRDELRKANEKFAEDAAAAAAQAAQQMQEQIANVFANGLVNGIVSALQGGGIGGAFKQLTATILQGFGSMLLALGQKALAASAFVAKIQAALATLNPWVLAAAGIALMALGTAMGGRGGAATSVAASTTSSGFGSGSEEISRFKFIDREGNLQSLVPRTPIHFTLIGANDPKVQREVGEIVEKMDRRRG